MKIDMSELNKGEVEIKKELEDKHNEINILLNIISNIQKGNTKEENKRLNKLLQDFNN